MIVAFLAEALGTLAGTSMDPLLWGCALLATLIPRGQPWTALALAVVGGTVLHATTGQGFSLAFWPMVVGRVGALLVMVTVWQAVHRWRRSRVQPAGNPG